MADDADFSQHLAEQQDAAILARGRRNAMTPPARRSLGEGGETTHCIECEAEIPEARRRAIPGCTRCVKCQTQHEHGSILNHWR